MESQHNSLETPAHPLATEREHTPHVCEIASRLSSALGRFGASILAICSASFVSLELARNDTAVVVIGVIAVVAMVVTLFANYKKVA